MAHSVMREEGRATAYITVSDQVVNADLLPCTVINALLTLFWRLNRKKAICFT